MRIVSLSIAILVTTSLGLTSFAAELKELGVPGALSSDDLNNQGYDLLNKGDYTNAKKYFDAAIQRAPDQWRGYYNRASVFLAQNKLEAALPDLNTTIRLQPAFFEASWVRAVSYLKLRNYPAALKDLNALAKVTFQVGNPGELALTLNERAWLRATCPDAFLRNGQLAVADAKKACELEKWKKSGYIDTLAAACAEAGDFDSAIRYEEQAISVNKSGADDSQKSTSQKLANELAKLNPQRLQSFSQHLELYKQHHPYHNK